MHRLLWPKADVCRLIAGVCFVSTVQALPAGPQNVWKSTLFGWFRPRAQSPFHGLSQLAQGFPILHRQLYNECSLIPLPYIACRTARKSITAMVDLYERRTAAVAATGHESPVLEVRTDPAVDESSPSQIESQNVLSKIV